MAEYLMEMMKRIAVFTIIAQTILHFRPNKSYEKYLKMLIGIMVMAIFTVMAAELFQKESVREYELLLEGYEKNIDKMYETSDFQMDLKKEAYLYTIQKEIKDRFNNISNKYGYTVENVHLSGIFEEMEDSMKDSGLQENYVEVTIKPQKDGISTVQVDKIKLGGNKSETVSEEIAEPQDTDILILRSKFAASIGIAEESIRILWKAE